MGCILSCVSVNENLEEQAMDLPISPQNSQTSFSANSSVSLTENFEEQAMDLPISRQSSQSSFSANSLSSVSVTANLEGQVLDLTKVLDFIISRQQIDKSSFSVIPHDLLIDILSRNPARTITRIRCVSKRWASILRRPDFTRLFIKRSTSRPRLLFTFIENESFLFFFSTPQPQNPDGNSSLVAVADHHRKLFSQETDGICRPVNGLICTINQPWEDTAPVIFNPGTGQSIYLPRLKEGKLHEFRRFGYDPIDKLYKVLSMVIVKTSRLMASAEHHILTLDNGESVWREIRSPKTYKPLYDDGICINGVLYYPASAGRSDEVTFIVCFDVRAEKFSFVNTPQGLVMGRYSTLIKYKGKLCALYSKRGIDYDEGGTGFLELWILEDPENHIWSSKMYQIPSLWRTSVQKTDVYIAGMTSKGEFVLSPSTYSSDPLYVFFYDPEKITFTRVEILGMERMMPGEFQTYIDYIEDVTLM